MYRVMAISGAAALAASGALAQDFGGEADVGYAEQLWQAMVESNLAGENALKAFPYEGTDPHGMMLETFYAEATVDGHSGTLVVKRNYGPAGVTVDQVLGSPAEHFEAVTIMFKREEGYAPDSADWFWAKYLPDGSLDQTPEGVAMAGNVAGCIGCHSGAEGDFLFTTDASFD